MKTLFARFLKDESGATAIEYALLAAGISVVVAGLTPGVANGLNRTFTQITTALGG